MQPDATQTAAREEAELRRAGEEIKYTCDVLWIRAMRKAQGYSYVGAVNQHIGQT